MRVLIYVVSNFFGVADLVIAFYNDPNYIYGEDAKKTEDISYYPYTEP